MQLKIKSERTSDIDSELCAGFIEWQQALNRVNWTKLIQISNEKWYGLARKKIDQQILHGSEC